MSLSREANDPACFWEYIVFALQRNGFPLSWPADSPDRWPGRESLENISTSIINIVSNDPSPTILILDDLQWLDQQDVCRSLSFFIEKSPDCMHFVLATAISRQSASAGCGYRAWSGKSELPTCGSPQKSARCFCRVSPTAT